MWLGAFPLRGRRPFPLGCYRVGWPTDDNDKKGAACFSTEISHNTWGPFPLRGYQAGWPADDNDKKGAACFSTEISHNTWGLFPLRGYQAGWPADDNDKKGAACFSTEVSHNIWGPSPLGGYQAGWPADDDDKKGAACFSTVSFHNFKSQNFKLSVSNPKNKYFAYVSVLSQISNCQSLGRKNKHETLKTGRTEISPAETIWGP